MLTSCQSTHCLAVPFPPPLMVCTLSMLVTMRCDYRSVGSSALGPVEGQSVAVDSRVTKSGVLSSGYWWSGSISSGVESTRTKATLRSSPAKTIEDEDKARSHAPQIAGLRAAPQLIRTYVTFITWIFHDEVYINKDSSARTLKHSNKPHSPTNQNFNQSLSKCLSQSSLQRSPPPQKRRRPSKPPRPHQHHQPLRTRNRKPSWQRRSCTRNAWKRNMRSVRVAHKSTIWFLPEWRILG